MREFAKRFGLSILWALAMPPVGFAIFTILTILPAFGLILGPLGLLRLVYELGFVPSLLTALIFHFLAFRRSLPVGLLVSGVSGCVLAILWYKMTGIEVPEASTYFFFALSVATLFSVSLMPLATHGKRREMLQQAKLKP